MSKFTNYTSYKNGRVYCPRCEKWFDSFECDKTQYGRLLCPDCRKRVRTRPRSKKYWILKAVA